MGRPSSGKPPLGLLARDRLFLREYAQFGYMHHVIAAEAFRRAYAMADEVAARMREQVDRTDAVTARATVQRMNDGARVQTVVVARLLSELAAAIEDLAALIHAVRHRQRRGVLIEYLEAKEPAGADVLDMLLKGGAKDLPAFLNLPPLSGLGDRLPAEAMRGLEHDYRSLGGSLAQIAGIYRDRSAQGVVADAGSLPADQVAIVLELLKPGVTEPEHPGGLLARTHNKIKHRFAVIEDLGALLSVSEANLLYTQYPRDPSGVKRLIHNITQVALVGAELAALMVALDQGAPASESGHDPNSE